MPKASHLNLCTGTTLRQSLVTIAHTGPDSVVHIIHLNELRIPVTEIVQSFRADNGNHNGSL